MLLQNFPILACSPRIIESDVLCLKFSLDGSTLYVGSEDCKVRRVTVDINGMTDVDESFLLGHSSQVNCLEMPGEERFVNIGAIF